MLIDEDKTLYKNATTEVIEYSTDNNKTEVRIVINESDEIKRTIVLDDALPENIVSITVDKERFGISSCEKENRNGLKTIDYNYEGAVTFRDPNTIEETEPRGELFIHFEYNLKDGSGIKMQATRTCDRHRVTDHKETEFLQKQFETALQEMKTVTDDMRPEAEKIADCMTKFTQSYYPGSKDYMTRCNDMLDFSK